MKKLKIIVAALSAFLVMGAALPTYAAETAQGSVCEGIGLTVNGGGCSDDSGSPTVNSVIHTVINIFSYIVGVAAIIMIIVGGFKYITSGGDSNKVGSAKSTITYALIGLIVAGLAQVLVLFVFRQVTTTPTATPDTSVDDCYTGNSSDKVPC